MTKELTAEEKAFFDNNGDASGLPADYAADVKLPAPDEGDQVATQDEPQANAEQAQAEEVNQGGANGEEDGNAATEAADGKKTVPLATHLEERRKRQDTEKALQQLQERQRIIDDRMAALAAAQAAREAQQAQERQQAQQAQHQAQQPQIPDPETDPIGAAKWAVEQITTQQRQQQEYQQMTAQQRHEAQQREQFVGQVLNVTAQRVEEYRQQDPSFDDAHRFLLNRKYNERIFNGETPQQAKANTHRDEIAFYASALQRGVDPARQVVEYARATGWQGQAAQASQSAANPAAERLARVEQGQQASVSPSTAGTSGNARPGGLNAKSLAEMSDKEFKDFLAKDQDGETWRKVMGA